MKTCIYCNHQVEDNSSFCPYCGKTLTTESICVNCSSKLPEGISYCPKCGNKIDVTDNKNRYRKALTIIFVAICFTIVCIGVLRYEKSLQSNDEVELRAFRDSIDKYELDSVKRLVILENDRVEEKRRIDNVRILKGLSFIGIFFNTLKGYQEEYRGAEQSEKDKAKSVMINWVKKNVTSSAYKKLQQNVSKNSEALDEDIAFKLYPDNIYKYGYPTSKTIELDKYPNYFMVRLNYQYSDLEIIVKLESDEGLNFQISEIIFDNNQY